MQGERHVRSLPETTNNSLRIRPCHDQQLVQHASSKRNTTPSCSFTTNCSDEVRVSSCIGGKGNAEEVSCGGNDGVECDAGFGVGVGGGRLRCGNCCETEGEEGCELHVGRANR